MGHSVRMTFVLAVVTMASPAAATDVAFLKGRQGCGGLPERYIAIDNEDSNNANDRWGWLGASASGGNTTLRLCVADSHVFRPAAEPYMLVSVVSSVLPSNEPICPTGGTRVVRYVDCENSRPACRSDIPGVIYNSNRDVRIAFCLFQGGTGFDFPDFGFEYGVFAPEAFGGAIESGHLYMDDQQASIFGENRNYWCDDVNGIYDALPWGGGWACSGYSDDRNYFDIMNGGHNTAFNLARVR
jgi:hypothetical protein